MGSSAKFDLELFIKAIDEASAPMAAVNAAIDRLTSPLKTVGKQFSALGQTAGLPGAAGAISNIGSAAKNVGVEAAKLAAKLLAIGSAAAYGGYQLIKSTIDSGTALDENSKRVKMTADQYAAFRFAAEQSGVSQEAFAEGLDKFNTSLGALRAGGGPLLEFLKKTSPALAAQMQHTKSTAEAIELMTGAMVKLHDTSKIADASKAAFGKGNVQFGFFLNKGQKAIAELEKRFVDIGGPQKDFAEESNKTDKALKESAVAFEALRNQAITPLLPAVRMLSSAFTDFVVQNKDEIVTWAKNTAKAIEEWIKGGGLVRLKQDVLDMAAAVEHAVDKIGGMKNAALLAAVIMGGPLLKAVSDLGVALVKNGPELVKAAIRIGAMVVMPVIGFLADFVIGLQAGYGALEAIGLAAAANPLAPFILAAAGVAAAGYEIYTHWGDLKLFFSEFWDSLVEKFQAGWRMIRPYIDEMKGVFASIPGLGWASDVLNGAEIGGDVVIGTGATPGVRVTQPKFISEEMGPSPSSKQDPTRLIVDFNGAPVGMRVATDPGTNTKVQTNVKRGQSNVTP
jgi:hypothetical protein